MSSRVSATPEILTLSLQKSEDSFFKETKGSISIDEIRTHLKKILHSCKIEKPKDSCASSKYSISAW